MFEVKLTKKMGRGLFATKNIKKDTLVHRAEFIKIFDEELNNCPTLAKYAFAYNKKYSMLVLGHGSLFNHSDSPNIESWITKYDGREVMDFYATKNIKKGEQLFIYYGGEEYAYYDLIKNKS
jgi:uncharacterized protein